MATNKILTMVILVSLHPVFSQSTSSNTTSTDTLTRQKAFSLIIKNTLINQAYLSTYFFMAGNSFQGRALSLGKSPTKATIQWVSASVVGLGLSYFTTKTLSQEYEDILSSGDRNEISNEPRYYQYIYTGGSIANITDFKAESMTAGSDGNPLWIATTPKVKTSLSFPSLGYGFGVSGKRLVREFETSLVSHYTVEQDVSYDAIPIPIGTIALPDRFFLINSLTMGVNVNYWLPEIGVKPYVGLGGRMLINSIQSQYPGPGDLTQSKGDLELDSITLNWGFHASVGVRSTLSNKRFLYAEFRPLRHYFDYESGKATGKEKDQFTFEIFEFRLGMGFYYN